MTRFPLGLAALLLALMAPASPGGDHAHAKIPPSLPHAHERASHPLCVSLLAHTSSAEHGRGGSVVGGTTHIGYGRTLQEDFRGINQFGLRPHGAWIFDKWSHGHRSQSG